MIHSISTKTDQLQFTAVPGKIHILILFHSLVGVIYECKYCFKIILQNIFWLFYLCRKLCNQLECIFSGIDDHT